MAVRVFFASCTTDDQRDTERILLSRLSARLDKMDTGATSDIGPNNFPKDLSGPQQWVRVEFESQVLAWLQGAMGPDRKPMIANIKHDGWLLASSEMEMAVNERPYSSSRRTSTIVRLSYVLTRQGSHLKRGGVCSTNYCANAVTRSSRTF